MDTNKFTLEYFNNFGKGTLPDLLGIGITGITGDSGGTPNRIRTGDLLRERQAS